MEQTTGMAYIMAVCALILFIIFTKEKLGLLVRFVCRAVVSAALIWGINQVLFLMGIPALVGVNLVTVLTSAILGFPGLCLLYTVSLL